MNVQQTCTFTEYLSLFGVSNVQKTRLQWQFRPISTAKLAELADAPDLGFQNQRLQNIALHFKKQSFYERKSRVFHESDLNQRRVNYWEIIADNLSKSDWSWGWVSAIDSNGRTIWIADAHRCDGKRFSFD